MRVSFINREILSLHAAALVLGGAAFLSRMLGLFRDRLLAARFGAGDILDSYYAAFQIPDILFTIFLVGAASAAVLPVFLEYEKKGAAESEKFVSNLLTVFGILAMVLSVAASIASPWLVPLVAPGFTTAKLALAVKLTRVMMLNAVFFALGGILSSVLQARHRFFVFALPPIVYNLSIIFGILFIVPWMGAMGLAYGVLLGGLAQILVSIPALGSMGFHFSPKFNPREAGLVKVAKTSLPRVLALSMTQLTMVVLGAIASFFASGSVSVFKFASNLMYVPVGLFGVSYALAIFPKLSGASLNRDGAKFREQIAVGVRNILFWVLPFLAMLVVLRAHAVRVILGSGVFNWEDTRLVAAVLAVLAVAMASESVLPLILRAFYALGRTREPLFWDIVGSLTTVIFAVGFTALFTARPEVLAALAQTLRIGDLAAPKVTAVALGFTLGSLTNVFLLGWALKRTAKERLNVALTFESRALVTMFSISCIAGFAAYLALLPFPSVVATDTFLGIFLQGATAGLVGFAAYVSIMAWRKTPEILNLAGSLKKMLLIPLRALGIYETEKLDGDGSR